MKLASPPSEQKQKLDEYQTKTTSPKIAHVTESLFTVLDDITPQEVLNFKRYFFSLSRKEQFKLFHSFAAPELAEQRSRLLAPLMRYSWTKLELLIVASVQAKLNKHTRMQQLFYQQPRAQAGEIAQLEAPSGSTAAAIEQAFNKGMSINNVIALIAKMEIHIVATEHPTDPHPTGTQALVTDIARNMTDRQRVERSLEGLQIAPIIPEQKRTVAEEVARTLTMAVDPVFEALPAFAHALADAIIFYYGQDLFKQHKSDFWLACIGGIQADGSYAPPILKQAGWAGNDGDGNRNITPATTLDFFQQHRRRGFTQYCTLIDAKKREIEIFNVSDRLNPLLMALSQLKVNLEIALASGESEVIQQNFNKLVIDYHKNILAIHNNLFEKFPQIEQLWWDLLLQLCCFGPHYGVAHVRQNVNVCHQTFHLLIEDFRQREEAKDCPGILKILHGTSYDKLDPETRANLHQTLYDDESESKQFFTVIQQNFQQKKYTPPIQMELERCQLVVQHPSAVDCYIVANTRHVADFLVVSSLFRIFPGDPASINIVPLLEDLYGLRNCSAIMQAVIAASKRQVRGKAEKRRIPEVMVGHSDSTREIGLVAGIEIKQAQRTAEALARDSGVEFICFQGRGGDVFRGGPWGDLKETNQGNTRNVTYVTPAAAVEDLERRFHNGFLRQLKITAPEKESHSLSSLQLAQIREFVELGAKFYKLVNDADEGLGKLLEIILSIGYPIVSLANCSSRATQRSMISSSTHPDIRIPAESLHLKHRVKIADLRAISAGQMKAAGRINIYAFGPGYALRRAFPNPQDVVPVLISSSVMLDIVFKLLLANNTTDFSFMKEGLLGEEDDAKRKELWPKDAAERKKWAEISETKHPAALREMNIDKELGTLEGQIKIKFMLAYYIAFLEQEHEDTVAYLTQLILCINRNVKLNGAASLLCLHPELEDYVKIKNEITTPLNVLFAQWCQLSMRGINLEKTYAPVYWECASSIAAANCQATMLPIPYFDMESIKQISLFKTKRGQKQIADVFEVKQADNPVAALRSKL